MVPSFLEAVDYRRPPRNPLGVLSEPHPLASPSPLASTGLSPVLYLFISRVLYKYTIHAFGLIFTLNAVLCRVIQVVGFIPFRG